MKKVILGLMTLLAFASCNKDMDFDPTDAVVDNYNTAFVKTFGEPSPTHTWGFGNASESRAITRTTVKETHEWANKGLTPPTKLTDAERADVTNFFSTNRFANYGQSIDWSEYWVEFVSRVDTTTLYKDGKATSQVANFTLDQFCVESPYTSGYEHVNDWNANVHPLYYLENVGTGKFRIWLSYTSQWVTDYTIQKYKGEYYLGFDIYGSKWDNGNLELGMASRGYYNDYIVRLVPGNGAVSNKVRIMAEDLSASDGTDFDFNDVVLDVEIINNNAFCELIAAGGTLPLRINGSDALEVHKMFGEPDGSYPMINTVSGKHHEREYVQFTLTNVSDAANIKLEVFKNGAWVEMKAEKGKPAAKFAVKPSVEYCDERQDIRKKYPNFTKWVKDEDYIWW